MVFAQAQRVHTAHWLTLRGWLIIQFELRARLLQAQKHIDIIFQQ